MKARKTNINVALKVAIVKSLMEQRVVGYKTKIGEVRLSKIVNGAEQATDMEKRALARVLKCDVASIFPETEALAS